MNKHEQEVKRLLAQAGKSNRSARKQKKQDRAAKNRILLNANWKLQRYLQEVGLKFHFPMRKAEAISIYIAYVGVKIPSGQSRKDWLYSEYKKKELPGFDKPLPSRKKQRKNNANRYKAYLLSEKWRLKKQELFALRGKQCEKCKSLGNIQVHHLHYRNIFNEKMEDLQVLCGSCHKAVHGITKSNPKGNTKGVFLKKKRKKRRSTKTRSKSS